MRASKNPKDVKKVEAIQLNRRLKIATLKAKGFSIPAICKKLGIAVKTCHSDLVEIRKDNLVKVGSLQIENILHDYQEAIGQIDRERWKAMKDATSATLKRQLLSDLEASQNERVKIIGQIIRDLGLGNFPGQKVNVNVTHKEDASRIDQMPEEQFLHRFKDVLFEKVQETNLKLQGEEHHAQNESIDPEETESEGETDQAEAQGEKKARRRKLTRKSKLSHS